MENENPLATIVGTWVAEEPPANEVQQWHMLGDTTEYFFYIGLYVLNNIYFIVLDALSRSSSGGGGMGVDLEKVVAPGLSVP